MLKVTEKALRQSISHWERMATGKARIGEGLGHPWCALCLRYEGGCDTLDGCPVLMATRGVLCISSPYADAYRAFKRHGIDSPEFRTAAQVEFEFLKSLLPGESK